MKWMWILVVLVSQSLADDKTVGKASKSIDFDGEVVEGVNKQPLDSLSQLSEADAAKLKQHLYRKRSSFKLENLETIREVTETY